MFSKILFVINAVAMPSLEERLFQINKGKPLNETEVAIAWNGLTHLGWSENYTATVLVRIYQK